MFFGGREIALLPRPLRLLSPACVASTAVALGATVSSDCLLQPFFEKSPLQRAIGAGMAAFFGVAGTRWALAREPSEWNALRGSAVTGAVVISWFMMCDRLASMHAPGAADSLAQLILPILLVVVAAIGAMVGTLFGLTAVAVVRPVERARASRALDATERVLLPASLWLCAWGLVFVALHHPRSLAPLALVVVGLGGIGYVVARDGARLRWLGAVYAGEHPAWRTARAPTPSLGAPIPAYGPYAETSLDGAVYNRTSDSGPYRAGTPHPPVARLPLSPHLGRAPIARRIVWSTLLATAILTITAARLDLACLSW
jgi:hypothetical protein